MVKDLTAPLSYSPADLYRLLAAQAESYQKHYRTAVSTSLPTETVQELLASIQYTLELSGGSFSQGQALLQNRLQHAIRELQLVTALTDYGSQWYWDGLHSLQVFLQQYDHLHFAHRYPLDIFYPTAVPLPEGLQGIDWVLCLLRSLEKEQEILSHFPDGTVQALFDRAPPDYWAAPENLCQQPLWNALGRTLLGMSLKTLDLPPAPPRQFCREEMAQAAETVCQTLGLEGALAAYGRAAMASAFPRLEAALSRGSWAGVFW